VLPITAIPRDYLFFGMSTFGRTGGRSEGVQNCGTLILIKGALFPQTNAVKQKRKTGFQISYVTITYRSVFLSVALLLAVAALVTSFAFPDFFNRLVASGELGLGKVMAKVGLAGSGSSPEPGPKQAHFTNIDGTVRVKKANSNIWVQADYAVALDRNDVVQTGPEGIAKLVFTDGTNYAMKPDSLIVIQENSLNAAQQTEVAVQVTTGTVDLATSNITPGSKSQVSVAGNIASFASETAAEVMNNPQKNESAILDKKGSVEVNRDGKSVKLAENEKVTIPAEGEMVKSKVVGPPVLIDPAFNQQVALATGEKTVSFSWSEVPNVRAYHVRISKNQFFNGTQMVFDKMVTDTQVAVPVSEGIYYWEVQSVGEDGKESAESEKPRFTVIRKTSASMTIALEVGEFVQNGHSLLVRGRTEPGATVLVNGQQAFTKGDGTFSHFTSNLPTGENIITVTAQNSRGGISNLSRSVTIQ
jgi:hypothetical protein